RLLRPVPGEKEAAGGAAGVRGGGAGERGAEGAGGGVQDDGDGAAGGGGGGAADGGMSPRNDEPEGGAAPSGSSFRPLPWQQQRAGTMVPSLDPHGIFTENSHQLPTSTNATFLTTLATRGTTMTTRTGLFLAAFTLPLLVGCGGGAKPIV